MTTQHTTQTHRLTMSYHVPHDSLPAKVLAYLHDRNLDCRHLPLQLAMEKMQQSERPEGLELGIQANKLHLHMDGVLIASLIDARADAEEMTRRKAIYNKLVATWGAKAALMRKGYNQRQIHNYYLTNRRRLPNDKLERDTHQAIDQTKKKGNRQEIGYGVWVRDSHKEQGFITRDDIERVQDLKAYAKKHSLTPDELLAYAKKITIARYTIHPYQGGVAWCRGPKFHRIAIGVKIFDREQVG